MAVTCINNTNQISAGQLRITNVNFRFFIQNVKYPGFPPGETGRDDPALYVVPGYGVHPGGPKK